MVSTQLREFIKSSEYSVYRISILTNIDKGTLSRFMAGKQLSLPNIDKICQLLNLSLKQNP